MFIKVTNAFSERAGDPLVININSIVAVYEDHVPGGSLKTIVWASDKLNWHVEESVEKIHSLIKAALSNQ